MQQILTHLSAHEAQYVDELCEYVRFPSVSAQPQHQADLAACAEWLAQRCRRAGLEARVCPTAGHPVVWAQTPRKASSSGGSPSRTRRPHYVIYGHYDVQPAEPLDLWKTPPFEPRLEKGALFDRGASDNKGQHLAHLQAVEAYLQTGTELPCDLTFIIEGEEEVGSRNLGLFLKEHRAELRCDAVVVSDTGMPSPKHPALTYALRGIAALEVKVTGPSRDLHSGLYGGSVDNPALALCQMLAQLRDAQGRVAIPGFYDDVTSLTAFERRQLARLPHRDNEYRRFLGVPALFGEKGFTSTERRCARPTLEINGLTSGYQGEGSKTIIPAWASAKLTMRLVPHQQPARIARLVARHLKGICPPTVRLQVTAGHGGEPYLVSPEGTQAQAALRALKKAFGRDPVLLREGGSIPIVTDFKKILGADTLLLGLALPDDNAHSPNEKFDLGMYRQGRVLSAWLWQELTQTGTP